MKKLVFIENDQPVTTSLKVAEVFEKNHQHVMRDIRGLIGQVEDVSKIGQMFYEAAHADKYGRPQPMYLMNRDGFTILAMGFTGKKALQFKLAYIDAFNRMEAKLQELLAQRKEPEWLEFRQQAKETYKTLGDVKKLFIEYARSQGYGGEDGYIYGLLAIKANTFVGLPKRGGRDSGTIPQLNVLSIIENGMREILINGMADDLHYTQIIAKVDVWLERFRKSNYIDSYLNLPLLK